jgi:hypothetical protein
MKTILCFVAILAAAGATFVTLDHTKKFETLQKDRLEATKKNKSIITDVEATEKNLKDETALLAKASNTRVSLEQNIDTLKSGASDTKRDVSSLEETLKTQEAEFAELAKILEEVNKILADLGGGVTLDTLSDKIQQIEDDLKAKQAKQEELETLVAAAEKLLEKNRDEMSRQVQRKVVRDSNIGRNSMESVITAVNQDWGFLVIGAGSNSGFTPQTNLLVQRDGRMIGRIRPSSIEPKQTIAEIDFNSLASGVRLQPGDRVMTAKPNTN